MFLYTRYILHHATSKYIDMWLVLVSLGTDEFLLWKSPSPALRLEVRRRKLGFLTVRRNIQSPPAVFVFRSSICVLRGIVFVQDRSAIFLSSAETDYSGSAEWFTAFSSRPAPASLATPKIRENVQKRQPTSWEDFFKGMIPSLHHFRSHLLVHRVHHYTWWENDFLSSELYKIMWALILLSVHHLFSISLQFKAFSIIRQIFQHSRYDIKFSFNLLRLRIQSYI